MSKCNADNNVQREMDDFVTMINFFKDNADNISPLSTISFLQSIMKFSEEIKPIYVRELIRLNGGE